MKKLLFVILIIIFAANKAYPISATLTAKLDSLVADTLLCSATIGLAVYDLNTDSTIYSLNSEKLSTPASNLKLFTSAAALHYLKSGYRFKTSFFTSGKLNKKGTLKGDLIIVGGGDPLISGRFRQNVTEILEFWADSIRAKGINNIDGRIIIDNTFFDGPELGNGWSWDDLSYWYACPTSALSFNDNCVDLRLLPGIKIGDKAKIQIDPQSDYITITNNSTTLSADSQFTLDYYRIPNTNDITFFGGISIDDTLGHVDYVSVDSPGIYCAYIFDDILKSKGIKTRKNNISSIDKSAIIEQNHLFDWYSDTLGVVISVINKNSQNFFAEQALKTIGKIVTGNGSFNGGIKAATAFFDSIGISKNDLIMADGSGLSYMNLVKPNAILNLLKYQFHSMDFAAYYASLPIAGVDRSLRNRLSGIENRDHLRAKTGFISGVSSFSGYIDGPQSGRMIAFSIIINNYSCPTSYAEDWEDKIGTALLMEY